MYNFFPGLLSVYFYISLHIGNDTCLFAITTR